MQPFRLVQVMISVLETQSGINNARWEREVSILGKHSLGSGNIITKD